MPPLELTSLIHQALADVREFLPATPTQPSAVLSERFGRPVWLKLEIFQPIRNFKLRGAIERFKGLERSGHRGPVVTASAGNHGLAVAWCARRWQWPADVFVPENANPAKVAAISREGGSIHPAGRDYQAAFTAACEFAAQNGYPFIHGFADPEVIAGQGTIGLEILSACPSVGTVIAGVGGGGLLSGIALAIRETRPDVCIVGVEPEGAASMTASLEAGHVVALPEVDTIADGLAPGRVDERTLAIFKEHVDEVRLVKDDELWPMMALLLAEEHLLVEPSAAVGLAAIERDPGIGHGDIVVVLSGGSISPRDLRHLARGICSDGAAPA